MATALATAEPILFQGPLGLMAPPEISIECDAFQGTLGTLLRCVVHQKIDLWDIPLHPICQAYLDYLVESDHGDVEGASAALVAMAYLVERKAFRLLPLPEPEPDEDWADAYDGPEILDFREVLMSLEERFEARQGLFFRASEVKVDYELPVEIGKVTVADLSRALETLLAKAKDEPEALLARPRRSLAEQMKIVARCLTLEPRPLVALVEGEFTRAEAMWWFLALLELIRLGEATVTLDGEALFARMVVEA